jgi:hypothetical protein
MDDVVISMTDAEAHLRVHTDLGRECAVLVDESAALLTRGIESASS